MVVRKKVGLAKGEQGTVLLMVLLLLTVITSVAIVTSSLGSLQLKASRNAINGGLAFQAAEDASNIVLKMLQKDDACGGISALYSAVQSNQKPSCSGSLQSRDGLDLSWSAKASETVAGTDKANFFFVIEGRACLKNNPSTCAVSQRRQGYTNAFAKGG